MAIVYARNLSHIFIVIIHGKKKPITMIGLSKNTPASFADMLIGVFTSEVT